MSPDAMVLPLANRLILQSDDVETTLRTVSRHLKHHTLHFNQKSERLAARLHSLDLGQVSVNYVCYGADIVVDPNELQSFYLVHMPISGTSQVVLGKEHYFLQAGQSIICPPDIRTKFTWSENCGVIAVKIDKRILDNHYQEITKTPLMEKILFDPLIKAQEIGAGSWHRLLKYILTDAENEGGLYETQNGIEQVRNLILTTLLTTLPHSHSQLVNRVISPAAPYYVKAAEDFMRTNLTGSITMDDLVHLTGVSARTIYQGFKHFRGSSPMRYFDDMRLAQVREELTKPGLERSISKIATKWGFFHLSGFAKKYKRRYHELPSETLRYREQTPGRH